MPAATSKKIDRRTKKARALGLRKQVPQKGGPTPKISIVPKGFHFNPKQEEAWALLRGPQRHTMLVGGARSGKTFEIILAILHRAFTADGSRHAILRLHYNHAKTSIWLDTLPKVCKLCFPDVPIGANGFFFHESDKYVELPNGSQVWVGGLDEKERVERILGQEHATLFFNECSQLPYSSVVLALTRLAQKCHNKLTNAPLRNRAYYDLNPVGTGHWTSRLFLEHKTPDTLESVANPEDYKHLYLNPEDNKENLPPEYLQDLKNLPERMRRRFYEGRYVAQLSGALWTLEAIESGRCTAEDVPAMRRVVVAIDPSGASGEFDVKADQIGIGAAGIGVDGRGYVFEDATGWFSPENWGRVACNLYYKYQAERILGEKNFGGDMVRAIIYGVDSNVSYKEVVASRGKAQRAEPIAALYERGLISHVGRFPLLEDEMTNMTTAGYLGSGSPNRVDWLVWALTELFPTGTGHGFLNLIGQESDKAKYGPAGKPQSDNPNLITLDRDKRSGFAKAFDPTGYLKRPVQQPAASTSPIVTTNPTEGHGEFLAEAQKEESGFMDSVRRLGKVATTKAPPTVGGCPKCGNKFLNVFSDTWKCGACGASGSNPR